MHKQLMAGLALAALGLIGPASAQTVTIAGDSGDNYTLYGTYAGANNGAGFQGWNVVGGDGGTDSFVNSQANIQGAKTANVFDLYDNGATLPSTATRTFSAPLAVGQTFSTGFVNEYVPPGGDVGVSLDNAAGTALFTLYLPNTSTTDPGDYRFAVGGVPASPLSGTDTGMQYSYYGGVVLSATHTATGYTFSALRQANYQLGTVETFSTTGTLAAGSGIASVVYFTANTGGGNDIEFNNLSIAAATPEPSQTAAFGLGVLGLAGLALAARRRATGPAA